MADDFAPIASTGIGSWPGADLAEALKINFAEAPELPYLPELPGRGVGADLIGRGTAVLADLFFDLQPAGWRLTGAAGHDQLRARAMLRDDLDQLEEAVQDYTGPFKISVSGPWTLSASVERPRGDRALADYGARREIAQSLAEGVARLTGEIGRRLPQLELIIQLDEPLLPAVLAGSVSTASGFSHHRKVDVAEVSGALTEVLTAVDRARSGTARGSGMPMTWLHCCAPDVPVKLIKDAGFGALAIDLDQLGAGDRATVAWDRIGQAMTDGMWLGAGALATSTGAATDRTWSADRIAQRVLRSIRTLGLEPDVAGRMIITPACGLARFDQRSAVQAMRAVRKAADIVTDQLAD